MNVCYLFLGALKRNHFSSGFTSILHPSEHLLKVELVFLFCCFLGWIGLTFALSSSEADGSPKDLLDALGTENHGSP